MILRRRFCWFCCRNTIQCAWVIHLEWILFCEEKQNENFAKTFWLITPQKRERKRASFGLVWYVGYFISFYFSWIFSDCSYVMHSNGKDATDSSRISQNFLFLFVILFFIVFFCFEIVKRSEKERNAEFFLLEFLTSKIIRKFCRKCFFWKDKQTDKNWLPGIFFHLVMYCIHSSIHTRKRNFKYFLFPKETFLSICSNIYQIFFTNEKKCFKHTHSLCAYDLPDFALWS